MLLPVTLCKAVLLLTSILLGRLASPGAPRHMQVAAELGLRRFAARSQVQRLRRVTKKLESLEEEQPTSTLYTSARNRQRGGNDQVGQAVRRRSEQLTTLHSFQTAAYLTKHLRATQHLSRPPAQQAALTADFWVTDPD